MAEACKDTNNFDITKCRGCKAVPACEYWQYIQTSTLVHWRPKTVVWRPLNYGKPPLRRHYGAKVVV